MTVLYFSSMLVIVLAAFTVGSARARALRIPHGPNLHSLPTYHGLLLAVTAFVPLLALYIVATPLVAAYAQHAALVQIDPAIVADELRRSAVMRDIEALTAGTFTGEVTPQLTAAADALASVRTIGNWALCILGLAAGLGASIWGYGRITRELRARNRFETVTKVVLLACSTVAVLTTLGIVFSVLFETLRFFEKVSPLEFFFGLQWSPQMAMRADQGDASGAFGIIPLIAGTFLITFIAMLVAAPLGLFSAIYMAEYATPRVRAFAKPILEVLAGIPTVVLGFFAALTVAPLIRGWGESVGLNVASESALAAGLVMGMMIIPFVSSLSDDVINAVPQSLRDGSYAMGATKSETIKNVVVPAAFPGIMSAMMLAMSRAVGETMIVVMAAGLAANLTLNPLQAVTTFTVQIKTILVGDQEFDSAKTLAAFALGFVLFFFTLALNFIALRVVQRYKEQYD
ncbi:phosphate ABC transporter permease subunit PstC [soil metagenome]